jgi:transcriptional regulator with GAF, ATPase, and Fis domain
VVVTGTGKELIARAIHRLSDRKNAALVKFNCAAMPTAFSKANCSGTRKGPSPECVRFGLQKSFWTD